MKTIALTQGYVARVDDADYARANIYRWSVAMRSGRKTIYAKRRVKLKEGKWGNQYLHRFLLGMDDPKQKIDHKNGDGLDNRRCNLRIATTRQNAQNRSNSKGVYEQPNGSFRSSIRVEGKALNLGTFTSYNLAREVYLAARKKHFGVFGGGQ
jgi:HNH endonuclease